MYITSIAGCHNIIPVWDLKNNHKAQGIQKCMEMPTYIQITVLSDDKINILYSYGGDTTSKGQYLRWFLLAFIWVNWTI